MEVVLDLFDLVASMFRDLWTVIGTPSPSTILVILALLAFGTFLNKFNR